MDDVVRAVDAARAGKLIVVPTDTVYGVGTRPDDPEATGRIFEAKRRPNELELPVLVPSQAAAEEVGRLSAEGRALAARFWPGPLTIVVTRNEASRPWALGGDPATVGVRVPDHPLAVAVLERAGPLAVTSANISGRPTPGLCSEVEALFGESVAVYVCDDNVLTGRASTVVDLSGDEPRILRVGALPPDDVLGVLSG